MAILSISVGILLLLISGIGVGLVLYALNFEEPGFGLVILFFPTLLGLLLVVPSTLYRLVDVFNQRVNQTLFEKCMLTLGTCITLSFFIIVSYVLLST
ncbi:hypothetical protein [Thalassotalea eurytherma]|uniref:Uncharacterized protein n=1 Tax=Thalassotalea eurytherma TaxID=1144278 RepID=A0ABQ6H1N6_9GAMM|nr:hypothetical protein [Thalassotalea eurytherma]GLX81809.1 hypothetical protein theurythT_12610 [Thalassotalea eurytherma]